MITAKHFPGAIPLSFARAMPARCRSAIAITCGTVKLTVSGRGDALGDAILEHVEPRRGRGQLDGDVRRPRVEPLRHRVHALAIAGARRVHLRAHIARLPPAGVERRPQPIGGLHDRDPGQRFGFFFGGKIAIEDRTDRRAPQLAILLECGAGEHGVRRDADRPPRFSPTSSSAGSAESCHHCVSVFSTTQSRYVCTSKFSGSDPMTIFVIGSDPSLKAESQSEPEQPLVDAFPAAVCRARDRRETAEVSNGAIRIELEIRHVGAWIGEVRRVRQVEDLQAELDGCALRKRELPEHAQVEVGEARAAHAVEAGRAESPLGDRRGTPTCRTRACPARCRRESRRRP